MKWRVERFRATPVKYRCYEISQLLLKEGVYIVPVSLSSSILHSVREHQRSVCVSINVIVLILWRVSCKIKTLLNKGKFILYRGFYKGSRVRINSLKIIVYNQRTDRSEKLYWIYLGESMLESSFGECITFYWNLPLSLCNWIVTLLQRVKYHFEVSYIVFSIIEFFLISKAHCTIYVEDNCPIVLKDASRYRNLS